MKETVVEGNIAGFNFESHQKDLVHKIIYKIGWWFIQKSNSFYSKMIVMQYDKKEMEGLK